MSLASLLPVVLAADNFPPHAGSYPACHPATGERYLPFHLCAADAHAGLTPVGLLRPAVVDELAAQGDEGPWHLVRDGGNVVAVAFARRVLDQGRAGMDDAMRATAEQWRRAGKFGDALGGWRNERYTIYAPPQSAALQAGSTRPLGNAAFALERSACAIWGFATFGVHMTAYEGEGGDMKIWVPRRSATKATMLDNTVAGGIPDRYTPLETMVKECDEEASLPEAFVRQRVRPVGACTYFYITDAGALQPEVEYIYDLPLPPRDSPDYILPRPHDDEVESFALLGVPQVLEALHAGRFKPNCGLILVDFLVRHGIVTPETEPNYLEIMWHLHRPTCVAVAL